MGLVGGEETGYTGAVVEKGSFLRREKDKKEPPGAICQWLRPSEARSQWRSWAVRFSAALLFTMLLMG
jgi:hypothetical protein